MTLELSPLQKHCLASIGITPWQQRQEIVNTETNESVKQDAQTKSSDLQVAEPAANYQHKTEEILPAPFITEIKLVINYVMEHSGVQLDWQIDHNQSSLLVRDNVIIIPNAAEFLTATDVKKHAWQLISQLHQ